MEWDPALVIRLVDAGSMFHQESHHVDIVIYACLRQGRKRVRPQLLDCVELSALGYMHTCLSAYVSGVACALVASLMERALHPRLVAMCIAGRFWQLKHSQNIRT